MDGLLPYNQEVEEESDLVIIGARPSMGKTAFALNIALNASEYDMSLIFSLEMSKK